VLTEPPAADFEPVQKACEGLELAVHVAVGSEDDQVMSELDPILTLDGETLTLTIGTSGIIVIDGLS
jgi:hypothetical protein